MRKLLILILFLSGCSTISVEHTESDLPKLKFANDFCHQTDAKLRFSKVSFTCSYELVGTGFF